MIRVGLTGNIGTGKSTVAKIFELLGVPVYHADREAQKFYREDEVVQQMISEFGEEIYEGGVINRKKLASIVFKDKDKLQVLNGIIHPLVRQDLNMWFEKMSSHAYAIQEAAILFETGFYKSFDKNIMVYAPEQMAISRVMKRDGVGEQEVKDRMKNQWDSRKKISLADVVILNDESQLVIPQVLDFDKNMKKAAENLP